MKKILLAVLLIFISTSLYAGAWTQEKGHIYSRLAFNYYYADEHFLNGGSKKNFKWDGDFKDRNVSLYVEYGLTDRLTALTSLYFKEIKKEDDYVKQTTNGFGDIDLALKYNVFKGSKGVFSLQGLIKIPEAYDENDDLPLGNGQYDYELRGLMGFSLWPVLPGYMNFELGYRWRSEAPADELRYLVEFGSDFGKYLYGRVKLDGILGMDNGEEKKDANGNPTLSYNYDLGKLDITFGIKIKNNYFIEFEYTPEIYGKNTSAGATYTIAIACKF
jgi:hypothetical protein